MLSIGLRGRLARPPRVADYLRMRRALGYKMDKAERLLGQFGTFAEDRGETHVRAGAALACATKPAGADAIWASRRMAEVRLFARHLCTLDPRAEVPADDLLSAQARRATPYLYTPREIAALMRATENLRGTHVQATYRNRADAHLGAGAHVSCTGKGRMQRITPLTSGTVAVMRAWLAARAGRPADPLFPTRTGRALSRDAVERRLAGYVKNATVRCPSLARKRVTMHVLRHSAAMRLLQAGIDTSVIALWLGHEQIETTQIYLHADLQIKERVLERTAPITTKPGRFRPADKLLAFLEAL